MVKEEQGHGDVKYGALFKKSGFFKPSSNTSWGKRFFLFNTRTLLLQYWAGEEERIFKVEQAVSGPPRSSISLLSSNLTVEQGPIERSMFGQKYPIKISNGPAFSGRTLVLATSSPVAREAWISAIQKAVDNLKERQRVNLVQAKIITDTTDPAYDSLENQYMIVKDKEAKVKELDQKISRLLVQCDLMRSRDRKLYNFQERLLLEHRDVEDRLFSMTQEETNPQRRFKFIMINHTQTMFDELPMGIYRHTAPKWVNDKMGKRNNPLNIPESEFHCKYDDPKTMDDVEYTSLAKTANRFLLEKNKDHKVWKLENKQYHPYVTYNTVLNNLDRQYDDSPKTFLNDATGAHEIRRLDDSQDYDLKSLREMNVFDFLKSEKMKPYFHLMQHVDRTDAQNHKPGDFFPSPEEIGAEIKDHDEQVEILDEASRHQDRFVDMNQGMREYLRGVNATSYFDVEHENRYVVDESGRRF